MTRATVIHVVRHPETEWNRVGLLQGHLDSPLTEAGSRTASRVARKLRGIEIDAAYTSDLGRCVQTAGIIEDITGVAFRKVRSLREQDFGRLNGKRAEEIRRLLDTSDVRATPPGGESFGMMRSRVRRFVRSLERDGIAEALLVTHDGPVRALRAEVLGCAHDDDRARTPPGQVFTFALKHGAFMVFPR